MRVILACLLALYFCAEPFGARAEVIYASVRRPFPVVMPLDYIYCRSRAWVEALVKAEKRLPEFVKVRLEEMGLEYSLGRLAICSLAFPIAAVTPEIASGDEIGVYLEIQKPDIFEKILRNPEDVALRMCIIRDMERIINKLGLDWPKSLQAASERMPELDAMAAALNAMWQAMHLEKQTPDKLAASLGRIARQNDKNFAIWSMLAAARIEANLPQGALEAADKALSLCPREKKPRDILLAANIHYHRSLAHWQLDQPALAMADLETAATLLGKIGFSTPLLTKILLRRGEFYRVKGEKEEMCANFQKACALGDCLEFSETRRKGICGQP